MLEFGGKSYKEHEVLSPFWSYPGSKLSAVNLIYPYLKNQHSIVSPFLGSGALEINLVNRGHEVWAYDYFSELANLWESIISFPVIMHHLIETLAKDIRKMSFIEYKAHYKKLQEVIYNENVLRASVFYVLLQTSISMIINSKHPSSVFKNRLSKNIISRISHYNLIRLRFLGAVSFEESIPKWSDFFLYLDPPYVDCGHLYGYDPVLHKDFDHYKLFQLIECRNNWALSYNDHPYIRRLYSKFEIVPLEWKYKMNKSKKSSEILILN